jgi:hypothetical protein
MKYVSQGDVNFRRVNRQNLAGGKRVADGVIARGEVTGHSHRLAELDAAELYQMDGGKMLLRVGEEGVSIVHEEHRPVELPMGDYEVVIDREYADEGERPVVD